MKSQDYHYKIGISHQPKKRLKQLQTGNPVTITLLFTLELQPGFTTRKVENEIHRFLKKNNKWIRGEWFRLTHDQVYGLAKTCVKICG
jgi:hypothetical protein